MEERMELSEGLWHWVIVCTSIMLDIVEATLVYAVSVWRCVEWLWSRFEVTGFHYKKMEECGSCPVFASYTLAFALQLR
jgi:hypothetical protein